MALVGNILLGTGAAPGMSSIASAYAESAASSRIPWSALEYSGQTITAISGSAIGGQGGGGGDTSQCMPISGMTAYQTVSSISSWTAELSSISSKQDALTFGYSGEYISSINGSAIIDTQGGGGGGVTPEDVSAIASAYAEEKLDKTASSTFQPSGNYAYQSSLSSYMPGSASSNFAPAGDYAYNSSLSAKLDQSAFTSYTATAVGHTYTGIDPIVVDNQNDQISLSASAIQLDPTMTSYMSGGTGFIGVNGNITSQMTAFVTTADMSGYIPTSESSKYYSTGNPSSFATTAQLDSGLSGKLDTSAQVVSSVDTVKSYVHRVNGHSISADTAAAALRSTYAKEYHYATNSSDYISSLRTSAQDLYSSKADTSSVLITSLASSNDYIIKLNGKEISAYKAASATLADKAKSALIGDTNVAFSAFAMDSAKLDASASSDFYSTSNPSGFLTSSYTPTFAYDADYKISAIDGSAIAGGCTYTSPSGTLAIDNDNGTIDVWNSSMRVDEHVTAASSFPGTAQQVDNAKNIYSAIWTGNALPGDVALISAYYQSDNSEVSSFSASAFGKKVGGGTAKLAELYCTNTGSSPYKASGTTSVTLDAEYSGIYMLVSSQGYFPHAGTYSNSISGLADVERPAQTAYSTSVYEQVLKDSMWQSLTAWAVSQGWTP